jgi:hypothetical protein
MFKVNEDPCMHVDWEVQCDQILQIHGLPDSKIVNLACVEFSGSYVRNNMKEIS